MASRKVSESGSYMSQYDQEVEKRLKALETEVLSLKSELKAKEEAPTSSSSDLEGKFQVLVDILKKNQQLNIEKLSKGAL